MSRSRVSFLIEVDICIERDADGYHAYCPAFKGMHVGGDTQREAVQNAIDGIKAYVHSLLKHHEPIPCCRIVREELDDEGAGAHVVRKAIGIPQFANA